MVFKCTAAGKETGITVAQLKENMEATSIYGYVKTQAYLNDVRLWAKQHTPTGLKILKTVDDSNITIFVVGMEHGFTCFSAEPRPAGTIFFDLKLKLSFNPGGASGTYAGFQTLHPYVAFLHEVGHAVQFIESPNQFFDLNHENPLVTLDRDIYNAVIKRAQKINREKALGIPAGEVAPWARRAPDVVLDTQGQQSIDRFGRVKTTPWKGPEHMKWSVRLEYDNMFRHERLICMESNQPIRDLYGDVRMG